MIDPKLREAGPAITDKLLRQFALLWLFVFGGLGAYQGVWQGRPALGAALGAMAIAVGVPGAVRPRAVETVFRSAMAIAAPIGMVVSHLVLATIFFVIIMPIALVFKLIGRDPLKRSVQTGAATHWVQRDVSSDPQRYLRQS